MHKIRNETLKVVVLIALFCSMAFADGEMGGGGLSDPGNDGRTGKTVITAPTGDGEMGGGGLAFDPSYIRYLMDSVYDYFDRMM